MLLVQHESDHALRLHAMEAFAREGLYFAQVLIGPRPAPELGVWPMQRNPTDSLCRLGCDGTTCGGNESIGGTLSSEIPDL